jgi:hypothetical protein
MPVGSPLASPIRRLCVGIFCGEPIENVWQLQEAPSDDGCAWWRITFAITAIDANGPKPPLADVSDAVPQLPPDRPFVHRAAFFRNLFLSAGKELSN